MKKNTATLALVTLVATCAITCQTAWGQTKLRYAHVGVANAPQTI